MTGSNKSLTYRDCKAKKSVIIHHIELSVKQKRLTGRERAVEIRIKMSEELLGERQKETAATDEVSFLVRHIDTNLWY